MPALEMLGAFQKLCDARPESVSSTVERRQGGYSLMCPAWADQALRRLSEAPVSPSAEALGTLSWQQDS